MHGSTLVYIDIYTCMQLPFSSSAARVRSSLCGSLTGWAATCWKSRQQRLPDPWYGLDILGCTWIPSEIGTSTASNLANNQEEIQSGNLTLQPLHIFWASSSVRHILLVCSIVKKTCAALEGREPGTTYGCQIQSLVVNSLRSCSSSSRSVSNHASSTGTCLGGQIRPPIAHPRASGVFPTWMDGGFSRVLGGLLDR